MSVETILDISDRKIVKKIHQCFEIFRLLIEDNRQELENIDEEYEKSILQNILLVPCKYDTHILNTIEVIEIIIKNIDFIKLRDDLHKKGLLTKNPKLNINVNKLILEQIPKLKSKTSRRSVEFIVSEIKRLLDCVSTLINTPFRTIEKVCTIHEQKYKDILS
jgi:hypothetical protein